MTAQPPLGESPSSGPRTFSVDMDPATVTMFTRDLGPGERVQFWSTFESTVNAPCPSRVTRELVDDVAAVFAGSKSATILAPSEIDEPSIVSLFAEENERYKSLAKRGARDHYGGQSYFIGEADSVSALSELYDDRGGSESPRPADESFHRGVGKALGYSPEAIDSFIAQIQVHDSKERSSRKGRIGQILSRISLKY